jgi:uncharacterized protein YaeQ
MALTSTRREYRLQLNHVDAGIERSEALVVAQHPSETDEHMTLRVLAWCLLQQEGLAFGPGLSTPDAPDLEARDLTGQRTAWIECGAADGKELKRALHSGVKVHAVFSDEKKRAELASELADYKRAGDIETWLIDRTLVGELAARTDRRQKWTVTFVGDHFYVEADGKSYEGAVTRGRAA